MKKQLARNSYKTATCSALMGVYLFKDGARVGPTDAPGPTLQLCVGDREWIQCLGGIPDLFRHLANESGGGRLSDLPEDWGVVANEAGEVLYRATTPSHVRSVQYLGHYDGELATGPVTIEMIGIGPEQTAEDQLSPRG